MPVLDTTAFSYALKTLYSQEAVENLVYEDQPFLAMVPKWTKFRGQNFVEAVVYTNVGGLSRDFSVAQANVRGHQGVSFTITRVNDYAVASIDGETVEASEGNEAALLEAVKTEMDSAIHGIRRRMGIDMYMDGTGVIGTISTIAANVITLSDAGEVSNFDDGQMLVFSASTSAALRSATAVEVTSVDRDAGTVTIASTPAGVVANDVIFNEGDYQSASDSTGISGLRSWIPDSAPGATTFFGVDRSVDTTRLGGVRLNLTGLPLHEALVRLCTRLAREGGRPDCAFISYDRYEDLINLLGSKVEYTKFERGDIGFDGVVVRSPKGQVKVYPDVNCSSTRVYALTKASWKFRSLKEAPRILQADGQMWLREPTADAYQIRVGYYGNLSTNAPGWNGVGTNFGS